MFAQSEMEDSSQSTETYDEGSLVWGKVSGYPW